MSFFGAMSCYTHKSFLLTLAQPSWSLSRIEWLAPSLLTWYGCHVNMRMWVWMCSLMIRIQFYGVVFYLSVDRLHSLCQYCHIQHQKFCGPFEIQALDNQKSTQSLQILPFKNIWGGEGKFTVTMTPLIVRRTEEQGFITPNWLYQFPLVTILAFWRSESELNWTNSKMIISWPPRRWVESFLELRCSTIPVSIQSEGSRSPFVKYGDRLWIYLKIIWISYFFFLQ